MKEPIHFLAEKRNEIKAEFDRVKNIYPPEFEKHKIYHTTFENDRLHDLQKIGALLEKYDAVIDLLS